MRNVRKKTPSATSSSRWYLRKSYGGNRISYLCTVTTLKNRDGSSFVGKLDVMFDQDLRFVF
jgi:hypothetical protein